MNDERRGHPRHELTFDLQSTQQDSGVVARMTANNLSMGGLQCTSTVDFPEMTRMAVRLMLPCTDGPRPIDVEAVVVRKQPLPSMSNGFERYEIALFFTKVDQEAREHLDRFLNENTKTAGLQH